MSSSVSPEDHSVESVIVDGRSYEIPAAVAAEMLRLHMELLSPSKPYSLDLDKQGIRARTVSAVLGALAFGAQGQNKPPEGHWLNEIWAIGCAEATRAAAVGRDRDEADRRAGAAERRLESELEASNARRSWLDKAKDQWGVDRNVSFDVVWAEALQHKAAAMHAPEGVDGDILPPIGGRVFIRHGRDDDAHACIVTGYYAWGDLGGNPHLSRVFVSLVYEGTDTKQSRMLCDCFQTAEDALNASAGEIGLLEANGADAGLSVLADGPVNCEQVRLKAWQLFREEVGTKGWTTGESATYYGFFCHGFRAAIQAISLKKRDIGEYDGRPANSTYFRVLGWNEAIDVMTGHQPQTGALPVHGFRGAAG